MIKIDKTILNEVHVMFICESPESTSVNPKSQIGLVDGSRIFVDASVQTLRRRLNKILLKRIG